MRCAKRSPRALGVLLPDNVLVEFSDDLARRQVVKSDLFFFGGSGK